MKNSIINKNITLSFFGILFIFLLWNIFSAVSQNDFIVPSPSLTFKALGKIVLDTYTYKVLASTLLRLFLSIVLSFILGVVLAVFSYLYIKFKYFIKPLIVLMKTIPVVAIVIMLLVIIGRVYSAYFIVGVVTLPIIYEGTLNGLETLDKDMLDEVKLISNNNIKILSHIYLPLIKPHLLTSLVQSFGLGLKVLIMAEFIIETKDSVGELIRFYKNEALTEYIFAWSIILIIFVLIIDTLLNLFKNKSIA
jgi:ABC-type nitrate/sulfonate/bicarbonate transport system permease component